MEVVRDKHDPVSRDDSDECDKSDKMRGREDISCYENRKHSAQKRYNDREEHLSDEHEASKMPEEHHNDREDYEDCD